METDEYMNKLDQHVNRIKHLLKSPEKNDKNKSKEINKNKEINKEKNNNINEEEQKQVNKMIFREILNNECPFIISLLQDDKKNIDQEKLQHLLDKLQLDPCVDQKNKKICIDENCEKIWRFIVQQKKKVVCQDEKCVTSNILSDYFFKKNGKFNFDPDVLKIFFQFNIDEEDDDFKSFDVVPKRKKIGLKAIAKTNKNKHKRLGNTLMRFLQIQNPKLTNFFSKIFDVQIGWSLSDENEFAGQNRNKSRINRGINKGIQTTFVLFENTDINLLEYMEYFEKNLFENNQIVRICIHILEGLYYINQMGYIYQSLRPHFIGINLDHNLQLKAVKMTNFDFLSLSSEVEYILLSTIDPLLDTNIEEKQYDDRFLFGLFIYELIYKHPLWKFTLDKSNFKHWKSSYLDENHEIHMKISMLKNSNGLQPISTIAYHFIVHTKHGERWTYKEAFDYLKKIKL